MTGFLKRAFFAYMFWFTCAYSQRALSEPHISIHSKPFPMYETDVRRIASSSTDPVRVGYISQPPYVSDSMNGVFPTGIAVDVLNAISLSTGLHVKYVEFADDQALQAALSQHAVHMSIAAQCSLEQRPYLLPTAHYAQSDVHLFVRSAYKNISNIKELHNTSKIAVMRNSHAYAALVKQYPEKYFVQVDDAFSLLTQLTFGKVDAAAIELWRAAFFADKYRLPSIHLIGPIKDIKCPLTFNVVRDESVVYNVINNGIKTLAPSFKTHTRDKLASAFEKPETNSLTNRTLMIVLAVSGVLLMIIVGLFVVWNRILKHQVMKKTQQLLDELAEKERIKNEAKHKATHDSLTGLGNRAFLFEVLQERISACKQFSVMFIDLDRFKRINDTYGHKTGDEMLIRIAQRLRHNISEEDSVFRLGGDEFVVVLPAAKNNKDAILANTTKMAERIIAMLSAPIEIDGVAFKTTPSIGISVFPKDATDEHELLQTADIAMYAAKKAGRGVVRFYDKDASIEANVQAKLERDLMNDLRDGKVNVWFQPRVEAATGKIIAAEALSRWSHELYGGIPPSQFIPIAEETGLINELGLYVLRKAITAAQEWKQLGYTIPVSVNISLQQLKDPNFASKFEVALLGFDPALIEFEITESTLMSDVAHIVSTLDAFKQLGIKISLDDFGTGYSSLGHIKKLPIDTIKIDKTFIRDVLQDQDDLSIVRAIVTMAHELQLRVVAEGVENQQQAEFLQTCACDELQGYFYGRPMDFVDFVDVLNKQ